MALRWCGASPMTTGNSVCEPCIQEESMKRFRTIAGVLALAACVGCADTMGDNPPTTTPDQPVGTTGTSTSTEPAQVSSSDPGVVPVGQQMDVRLQSALSSATATAEQRFEATTAVDLMQGDSVLIPAGSTVRGVVRSVDPAGKIDRVG